MCSPSYMACLGSRLASCHCKTAVGLKGLSRPHRATSCLPMSPHRKPSAAEDASSKHAESETSLVRVLGCWG